VEGKGRCAYTGRVEGTEEPTRAGSSRLADGSRILVVEDDHDIAELICVYLEREGLRTTIVGSAEEAVIDLAERSPDLLVLDLGLPGADGLELLRRVRDKSTFPVIIVSARESDEDKVAGLGLGADDFVSKPFSPKVLAARVKAQLRRCTDYRDGPEDGGADGRGPRAERLLFGPFTLDFEGKVLERGGRMVGLSRREFELLAFLASNEGRTFGPEELYGSVWGLEHGDLSTVAVHVRRIRQKIEGEGPPRWLVTVPGAGYRFVGMREDTRRVDESEGEA
jgi:DNA-binding response OmpR family regulator